MKRLLILFAALVMLAGVLGGAASLLRPWMDRWRATEAEVEASLPGDELVPEPYASTTRAVTIAASPESIYPWLLQMGADKGGLYSYTLLERAIMCPMDNAERIHPEWQTLSVGDLVKMCPEELGPPPYVVASIDPGRSLVLGHTNPDGSWAETWQFVIVPQSDGTSRLVVRDRTSQSGVFWDIIHPGIFIMERGMMLGIKARAEGSGGDALGLGHWPGTPLGWGSPGAQRRAAWGRAEVLHRSRDSIHSGFDASSAG
jgi:hypothetical protein